MRNLNIASLALAAAVACTPGYSKYEGPAVQQEEADEQLNQALRIVAEAKRKLIEELGAGNHEEYEIFVSPGGGISSIGCTVAVSPTEAYHRAGDISRDQIKRWLRMQGLDPEVGFTNDSRTKNLPDGNVTCVRSTSLRGFHGGSTNAE